MHLGFGWDGIGYHAVIERDGQIQRGSGRSSGLVRMSIAIMAKALGYCRPDRRNDFTPAQMDGLQQLLEEWCRRYPNAEIRGHCDFDNTGENLPEF